MKRLKNHSKINLLKLKHLNKYPKHHTPYQLVTIGVILILRMMFKQMSCTTYWLKIMLRMMMLCSDLTTVFHSWDGHYSHLASLRNGLLEFEVVKSKDYLDSSQVFQCICH